MLKGTSQYQSKIQRFRCSLDLVPSLRCNLVEGLMRRHLGGLSKGSQTSVSARHREIGREALVYTQPILSTVLQSS